MAERLIVRWETLKDHIEPGLQELAARSIRTFEVNIHSASQC